MNYMPALEDDPDIHAALMELEQLIAAHFPTAVFDRYVGEDPLGVRLRATVDIEDTDVVMDVVMDALYNIQVERGLPVYVVTSQPLERVMAQLRARADG
jgi:hypothetical protein